MPQMQADEGAPKRVLCFVASAIASRAEGVLRARLGVRCARRERTRDVLTVARSLLRLDCACLGELGPLLLLGCVALRRPRKVALALGVGRGQSRDTRLLGLLARQDRCVSR